MWPVDYFNKVFIVLKLPHDLQSSLLPMALQHISMLYFQGKTSAYPLDHKQVLGLSVTISALGGQGRDCRNWRRNSFLIHYFKQDRKGGLWLSWK